jgi:hypothetical protein
MRSAIDVIERAGPSVFTICFAHGGQQTEEHPVWADMLIEAGTNLIVGSGTNMFGAVDKRSDCWVIYNLGNGLFDTLVARKDEPLKAYSFAAKFVVENKFDEVIATLLLYPIVLDNGKNRFALPEEFQAVRKSLECASPTPLSFASDVSEGIDQWGRFMKFDLVRPRGVETT